MAFCAVARRAGMHQGKLVFSQLMAYLPMSTFRRCVARHRGDHKVKDFSCLDQFFAMAFAQLTYRESLRDIEVNLRAQANRLYHMGFRCSAISRNTLANANATRPWQIYADFAQHLIGMARPLYAKEPLGIDLDAAVYAFDASTIDLCLSLHRIHGHHFVPPRPLSNCTRCWTCMAPSPAFFISPTQRPTRSIYWTIWCSKQVPST